MTFSLLQHVLKMSSSSANASGKRRHHSQTAGSTTCISQASVTTVLKSGTWPKVVICVEFLPDVARQKLLKSANAARSYSKNKSGTFSPRCINCLVGPPKAFGAF